MMQKLMESEARYRRVFESAKDGIIILDAETGMIVDINPFLIEMLGYSYDKFMGKTIWDIGIFKDIVANRDNFYELQSKGYIRYEGLPLETSFGKTVEVEFVSNVYLVNDQKVIQCNIRDISDRVITEKALKKNEEQLREILENSLDSAYKRNLLTDSYEYMSPVFFKISGYTPEEMKTITLEELKKTIHPDDLIEIEKVIGDSLVNIDMPNNQMEYRFKHKNGSWIWLQDRFTIIRDAFKHPISIIGNVSDITKSKKLAEERLEMERELLHTQKLKSLGIMAGGIAHDFNNLLTIIIGNISLALMDKNNSSEAIICLDDSLKASHRAADLIKQMLAYSGKGRFVIQQMNLSKLVEENIHIFRSSIPTTTDLNFNLSDVVLISADVSQIQQVIMNLITNASEAIGNDIGSITITTGVETYDEKALSLSVIEEKALPGEFVYVEVVDTGCGMTKEIQKQMFDPFFTTKFTGRGLGMSALQGIIRGHGGAIFVNSKVNAGTTIRVLFPVSAAIKTPVINVVDLPLIFDSSLHLGYILIVDDEDSILNLCSRAVKYLGYDSITATNGLDAIEVFKEKNKDIVCVLLDLTMPKMDGYNTFKELKNINPNVKVILSSGYNEQFVTQNLTKSGLAGFLQKPYTIENLSKKIKEVLGDI